MTILPTNQWLRNYLKKKKDSKKENMVLQRELFCEKLAPYFNGATSYEIHEHLLQHGLFIPGSHDYSVIKQMHANNYWKTIKMEFEKLKNEWEGPNVPIFLFPANIQSKELRVDLNGMSGITHRDKVFLFVSDLLTDKKLQALITHEYNHVCRLEYLNQEEDRIQLLDSILLEGLAENAVEERVGQEYTGKWTKLYSKEFVLECWKRWLFPNLELEKKEIEHQYLLYGRGRIPKWLGYSVGYHIVNDYIKRHQQKRKDIMRIPSNELLKESDFPTSI